MPAKPRWLLAIPDAISQLEQLDRSLLTRGDIEQLFGVSTARATILMQTFGAEYDRGAAGRFAPGLPRISAGQLLFLPHMIAHMHEPTQGAHGSRSSSCGEKST